MSDAATTPVPRAVTRLEVGSIGHKAFGWWGMLTLLMTEGALFAYLLFSYYYFAVQYGHEWLPGELPHLNLSLPNTIVLLASSVAVWWGERGIRYGRQRDGLLGVAAGLALGVLFVIIQGFEWHQQTFTLTSSSYGSLFFTITGLHMAHVIVGDIVLAVLLAWIALGLFDSRRNAAVSIGALYWHFVDAVWLTLFFTFYITPRLG